MAPRRARAIGGVALGIVLVLQVLALEKQSLTNDAAYHLLAGHQMVRHGENALNLEHPPLIKMLIALPLLAEEPLAEAGLTVDRALDESVRLFEDPARAERVRRRARTLLLFCIVLPWFAACFFLGRHFGGEAAGWMLCAVLGLSFSILPTLLVLQTDSALALATVLLLLAGLRYRELPAVGRAIAVGLAFGLALASKHSAVLLGPTFVFALVATKERRRIHHLAAASLVALAVLWTSYAVADRHGDPELRRETIRLYADNQATLVVDDRMRGDAEWLLAVDKVSPHAAQWLVGVWGIRVQNAIGIYLNYAFGSVSSDGRWWYFPVLLLAKLPLALLIALACAIWAARRRGAGSRRRGAGLLVLTAMVYLLAAMTSSYNLGLRHLLPILPILLLPAASWAARRPARRAALVAVLALESFALAPLWMSATNTWWLGDANPTRVAFGDMEYRQNLLALAEEAEARGIERLGVLYPLLDEVELRASVPMAWAATPERPVEPGWYAVDVLVEQLVPAVLEASPGTLHGEAAYRTLAARWLPLWDAVAEGEDHGEVAGTFHLYRVR